MEICYKIQKKFEDFMKSDTSADLFHDTYSNKLENNRRIMLKTYSLELIKWMMNEFNMDDREDQTKRSDRE